MKIGAKCDSKEIYGHTLVEIGAENSRVVVVEADLMKASGSAPFLAEYPNRHYNVGIAEQNLLGFSAGLASMGKIPFAAAFANFISQRACDQMINSVAYNRFNVKMVGCYAGLTSEKNGGTHISVADMAIFRSTPGVPVADPADAAEFARLLRFAAEYDGPMYIRQNKGSFPVLFDENHQVSLGRAVLMRDGGDIGLITTGIATQEAVKACRQLDEEGIHVRHVHMPFVKPIDMAEVVATAEKTKIIITVENHSIYGGLGSAAAEVLCEQYPARLYRLGMQDCFGETAPLAYLIKKFGIDKDAIAQKVHEVLGLKGKGEVNH